MLLGGFDALLAEMCAMVCGMLCVSDVVWNTAHGRRMSVIDGCAR
jgi:hypothetical protein